MKLYNRILSVFLAIASVFTFAVTALAAPSRNTGTVNYLSEVAIIEAKSLDGAKKVLEELKKEENGAFTGIIETDLNEGGKTKVYLAYKTSTNVDDAITDLSVMNMSGNFSVGSYEKVLSDTIAKYESIVKDYRLMAEEFRANYNAGYINAKIAYRQMNYYFVEKDGVKTYMGDFFLNFPENNMEFVNILFYGNLNIIANIRALMAMGIGKTNSTLSKRIETAYKEAETNLSIYTNPAYTETAKSLKTELENMKNLLLTIPEKIEKYQNSTEEELPSELKEYSINSAENTLLTSKAFLEILKSISMGNTTLGDYVMNTDSIDEKQLFPIVHAGTVGEKKMMEYRSFYNLLVYDELEGSEADIENKLLELEKDYTPLSVYHGVQNDLQKGTIAVTGDAEICQGTTGQSVLEAIETEKREAINTCKDCAIGGGVFFVAGVALIVQKQKEATVNYNRVLNAWKTAKENLKKYQEKQAEFANNRTYLTHGAIDKAFSAKESYTDYSELVTSTEAEVRKCADDLSSTSKYLSWGHALAGGLFLTLGVVTIVESIKAMNEISDKYEVNYTDIPDNMVDVVSNDVHGDRFINYKNVPSYRLDGEKLSKRQNDLNGYSGKEWLSLYYTKNHEAGKCLTATPDFAAGNNVRAGYSPIHLFGHTSNYNLNSFCNRKDASEIFLSFKYSTNQKSADTDIPDVIGSSFNKGYIAISGFGCLALGMLAVGIVKKKKNVKKDEEAEDEVA